MKYFLPLLLLSNVALADVHPFEIEGMTCGGCVKNLTKAVCKEGMYAKCEVSVGHLTITTKEGQKLNTDEVKKQVEAAGYKISNPSAK